LCCCVLPFAGVECLAIKACSTTLKQTITDAKTNSKCGCSNRGRRFGLKFALPLDGDISSQKLGIVFVSSVEKVTY
jgi:hypothetical protein